MSITLGSIGLDATVRVSRSNVREIDVVFNSEHVRIEFGLDNQAAAELAERIISLIGAKVVFPVGPKP